jgi:hypothetical protein
MTKLGSTKKLPKTPRGEREETFKPLNPESGERRALTEKGVFQGVNLQGQCSSGETTRIHL